MNKFVTRATSTSTPVRVTAINKSELKLIKTTMASFGYTTEVVDDRGYAQENDPGYDYSGEIRFELKKGLAYEIDPDHYIGLVTSSQGGVFDTGLDYESSIRLEGENSLQTKGQVNGLFKEIAVVKDLLGNFEKAINFLSQYVGKGKAPTR